MVDLRSTLRPLVDEPARERLPVTELAERATQSRKRRLRRRTALAGLATVAVVAVGGSLATRDRDPDQVTTVHGPDEAPPTTAPPATSEPSPGSTGASAPSTSTPSGTTPPRPTTSDVPADPADPADAPAGPEADGLVGNDSALVVSQTTTSEWENGHCVEHRVENTGDAPVTWTVELTPAGAIDTMWNARIVAEDGPRRTFAGEDWNATIAPGAWTTFGTCLATS